MTFKEAPKNIFPFSMFYCLVNFVLGLAARARACGRVTSGTRLGPWATCIPRGQVYTPSTWDDPQLEYARRG